MTNTRITTEAIEALEKLGVSDAVNYVGQLLRQHDGVKKHGEQGWRDCSNMKLMDKLKRHTPPAMIIDTMFDRDSKMLAIAHTTTRALMLTQRAIEAIRQAPR